MMFPQCEEDDEFHKYYSQFRPRHGQQYSPAASSYYSSYSDTDQYNSSVYRTSFPRSRSHGRDWSGFTRTRTVDQETFHDTDNVSRDSGHSSASSHTPDWRLSALSDSGQRPVILPRRSLLGEANTSQQPVILPRRSLQGEANTSQQPPKTHSQKPARSSFSYVVITISIVVGSLAILWSAHTRHSCQQNNETVWDLQLLTRHLHDKVIGQNNPIGKLEGIGSHVVLCNLISLLQTILKCFWQTLKIHWRPRSRY